MSLFPYTYYTCGTAIRLTRLFAELRSATTGHRCRAALGHYRASMPSCARPLQALGLRFGERDRLGRGEIGLAVRAGDDRHLRRAQRIRGRERRVIEANGVHEIRVARRVRVAGGLLVVRRRADRGRLTGA